MATAPAERSPRLLGLFHVSFGAVLITRPGAVTRALHDSTPPRQWVIRLLGARSVMQGAVTSMVPDAPVVAAGAIVDGLHAASMIATAVISPPHRRAAVLSAIVAGACCVAGATCCAHGKPATSLSFRRVTANRAG
jgi:hypothetical protein